MPVRREIVTFATGGGLAAVGLLSIPNDFGYLLLTGGSTLISLSFALIISQWRAEHSPTRVAPGKSAPSATPTPTPPSTQRPQAPSKPPAPAEPPAEAPQTHLPPTAPTIQKPSVTALEPPTPVAQQVPSPPTPPSAPSYEQPKLPGRKMPSLKAPKITMPKPILENKVPVALLVGGLLMLVASLFYLFPTPVATGFALLIPGLLFSGLGALLLYQRLKPAPVIAKRFCMHCGFQMLATDPACGRCHRQPPSGVDTKVCPNCTAVIPTLAKFCRECGAGQPMMP